MRTAFLETDVTLNGIEYRELAMYMAMNASEYEVAVAVWSKSEQSGAGPSHGSGGQLSRGCTNTAVEKKKRKVSRLLSK